MGDENTLLGQRQVWGGYQPLVLSRADRRRHMAIFGQTGVGKSTLMRQLLAQDIAAGDGCALIDPHGDLAAEILDHIPSHRVDDVIILDPSDIERPVGFNPFYRVPEDERALVAANLTATFKHVWRDSWGPRLEYILFNTIAALLDAPDQLRPTFLSIPLMLVDQQYRQKVIRHINDNRVHSFFVDEFEQWPDRQLKEAISPVQNKVGQFLSNPFIRNVLGQWRPSIDLANVMERRRILLVRVSKGLLGEEPANLFGSLLVTGFQQAAMRRVRHTEQERQDFHLHIDEFHNFTTDSFASVLSEARKYRLTLTTVAQYLSQLSPEVREAVFGNVGSLIAFRVAASDAERLAKEIGGFAPAVLGDLGLGEICARLTVDGATSLSCRGITISDAMPMHGHAENIIKQTRQRYGRDRQTVEEKFVQWLRQK